ncbi:molybdopterin converting factor subunit 1 [Candidatus Bathyarchaeota archaeon]|jgi:sulfur-carrier protein|nr:molybdopterin converting factor subunit 1 [Candidatus Bathyarchaeota archaeon]MBT4319069.1 molybdopterin converting factor subunit 1 [Candidatus Bathyarchaeota archaeon]MBT4424355.1 molybdopterin converting factor subunit 1 [Candidatus Bathyarchaeota archaeon]MBT5642581.1 molybdopterin converting factor subunit 1 [Candidatus Bathyarchaeota archaeon]MBT6604028.1 molybdopterin converting factor subunit 1 [Candidatus Bathyarchaeota archaeon]
MKIKVTYYGQFRDITGLKEEEIEAKDGVTVVELRDQVRDKYAKIAAKEEVLVAINNSFTSLETVVKKDDKVAFFPPVSGG